MSLQACASKQVQTRFAIPPAVLMEDCKRTPVKLEVNGDLVLAYQVRDNDLARCTVDKQSLRAWATEVSK